MIKKKPQNTKPLHLTSFKSIYKERDIESESRRYARSISKIVDSIGVGKLSMDYNSHIAKLCYADILHALVNKPEMDKPGNIIRNLALNMCHKAKKTSSIGDLVAVLYFISHITKPPSYEKHKDPHKQFELLAQRARLGNLSDIHELVNKVVPFSTCNDMIMTACQLAGADGTLFINDELSMESSVELVNGYRFPISIDETFASFAGCHSWHRKDPRVIIIDGLIENPAEIDKLLTEASEKKEPLLIVARGFSRDVTHTMAINFARGTTDVIPASVPYDLLGANLLVDIAIACSTDVVSSLKGELISSIKLENCKRIEEVRASFKNTLFKNPASKDSMLHHATKLTDRRISSLIDAEIGILNKRISCCSPTCVYISFGKSENLPIGIMIDRAEVCIKAIKESSRSGFVEIGGLLNDPHFTDVHLQTVFKKLIEFRLSKFPIRSLLVGLITAKSMVDLLGSSKVFITNEI